MSLFYLIVLGLCLFDVFAQKDPHFSDNRTTIVHLFEWKWNDIADECERFLQHQGYGGVQISPPSENLVVSNRPWWERYQPVSYIINTRSGDENDFLDMTARCNAVGDFSRIFVDIVINHMTGLNGIGTAGNVADHDNKDFPAVPYNNSHFHATCEVNDFQDASNVRNCELGTLVDLHQGLEYVRSRITEYMDHLIDLGVAGFRMDAAKHMWPADLGAIYLSLKDLNTEYGFPEGARPFIYQEVIDFGGEAISKTEYTDIGTVCEFQSGVTLSNTFKGNSILDTLENWGTGCCNLVDGLDAVAFIDNHDNQRAEGTQLLTYKNPRLYKMAVAFMQAHPYGTTRVMSSFDFDDIDQGPPQDSDGNLISPSINDDGTCGNGYICEHRWRQIFNMVGFRNTVVGTNVENWWSDGNQQIAFSRGNRGFIAFTLLGDIDLRLFTSLPEGTYCDVISGSLYNGSCSGKTVTVDAGGYADVFLGESEDDGVLAIHVNAKL